VRRSCAALQQSRAFRHCDRPEPNSEGPAPRPGPRLPAACRTSPLEAQPADSKGRARAQIRSGVNRAAPPCPPFAWERIPASGSASAPCRRGRAAGPAKRLSPAPRRQDVAVALRYGYGFFDPLEVAATGLPLRSTPVSGARQAWPQDAGTFPHPAAMRHEQQIAVRPTGLQPQDREDRWERTIRKRRWVPRTTVSPTAHRRNHAAVLFRVGPRRLQGAGAYPTMRGRSSTSTEGIRN
jgi:hypothetical protein